MTTFCIPFSQIRNTDVVLVGGKNASLGEMFSQLAPLGIRIPDGFAVTAAAYRFFLQTITYRTASRKLWRNWIRNIWTICLSRQEVP